MFNISKITKLFNKKNRMIVSQKFTIGDLKEKLKNSQCYANALNDDVENLKAGAANMSKLISEYYNENRELQGLYDSLKDEYKRVDDWANSRPVFVD